MDEAGFLWVGHDDEDGNLVIDWKVSVKEARERAQLERAQTEARFRDAPFALFGLDPEWDGDRYLGGGWWSGPPGKEKTKSLGLAHGTLVHGEGPMLIVETGSEFSIGGGDLLSVAGLLWEGRAASIEEAVAQDSLQFGDTQESVLPEHADFVFDVDGVMTEFDGYTNGEEWVARAKIGSLYVTLTAQPFDAAEVVLASVADIEPYVLGTRRFDQRDH